MSPKDREDLASEAKPGGRPTTAERGQRLAAAHGEQRAAGKRGRAAYIAARDSEPLLREKCRGLTYEGLVEAVKRGKIINRGSKP
jgi:hypothetical protein